MRKIELSPKQILVTTDLIRDNRILEIYWKIVSKGHFDTLPPPIVARPSQSHRGLAVSPFAHPSSFDDFYKEIDSLGNVFYLMDGNHRTLVASLCNLEDISVLELQGDEDFIELGRMKKNGHYPNLLDFKQRATNSMSTHYDEFSNLSDLSRVVAHFEYHLFLREGELVNLRKKTDLLVENGLLPKYMVDGYNRGKK